MTFQPRTNYGNLGSTQWMQYAENRTGVAMPNCFTYATARISEILGHNQSLDGSSRVRGAGDLWETHAPEFSQSKTAVPGALAIFKGDLSNFGHVAVVEVVGSEMAISQSNYGGNVFDYLQMKKTPGSYYPNGYNNLVLCGFLIHKELGATGSVYNDSMLINESGTATLKIDVNKRRDRPDGMVVETLKAGRKLEYTQKFIGFGHRYISWVEREPNGNQYRYFVAVSGSENYGTDVWADIGGKKEDIKVTNEHGWCKFKVNGVAIRKNSIDGEKVGTANTNTVIEYTKKCSTSKHRYIIYSKDGIDYYVACSPTSEQKGEWCDFYATNPNDKPTWKDFPDSVKFKGCDISEHNSNVNYNDYEFIIIRATYGEYEDPSFKAHLKATKEAGKPFGVYCYDYALDDSEALAQAKYMVNLLQSRDIVPDLGVWIDMEDDDGYKQRHNVLNKERCTNNIKIFCDYLKSKGYYTGAYSTQEWFTKLCPTDYPKWVANWGTNDGTCQADFSEYAIMHQYTAKGIDKDVLYIDMDQMKSHPVKEEPPKEDPKEDKPSTDDNELKGLLGTIINLLKSLLSIFGK